MTEDANVSEGAKSNLNVQETKKFRRIFTTECERMKCKAMTGNNKWKKQHDVRVC